MTTVTSIDLIDAAMCLWEDVLDSLGMPARELHRHHDAVINARRSRGTAALRWLVAALAEPCHRAWEHAQRAHGYEDCFDWEWCPWFLRHCVNWETVTVRPDWQDIVDAAYSGDREN